MKAVFDSLVRTVVPYIGGAVISWLTTAGMELDSEFKASLTAGLMALFGTIYYIGVRLLEVYVAPKFGWLLGLAKSPVYVKTEEPIAKTAVVIVQAPADGSSEPTVTAAN